ncbi:hypothetical protein ACOM2C_11235 [Pseudarthrobacter sp. So.54]
MSVTASALADGRPGIAGLIFHSRICAAVTALSCLAHLWLVAGNQHGTWLNLLMLAMVAMCLPCAAHIWRRERAGAVRKIMASALMMAGVHAVLLLGTGAGSSTHAHHAAAPAGAAAGTASGAVALLAVIALEMVTALMAATLLARLRAQSPC